MKTNARKKGSQEGNLKRPAKVEAMLKDRLSRGVNSSMTEPEWQALEAMTYELAAWTAKERDPDAARGRKVINAASKGGRAKTEQHYKAKRQKIRTTLADYMKKHGRPPHGNGHVSLTAAREKIATGLGVSRRTVERYTADLFRN